MKPAFLIRELPVEAGVFHASVRVAEVTVGPDWGQGEDMPSATRRSGGQRAVRVADPGEIPASEPIFYVVRTYRNDAEQVPGRPVWQCLDAQSGQWVAESEVSIEAAVAQGIEQWVGGKGGPV